MRGIVDEADVRAGKVEIIAPRGFMSEFAVSENVYAGNAMNRRVHVSVRRAAAGEPLTATQARAST